MLDEEEKDDLRFLALLCLGIFALAVLSGGILGFVLARLS